MLWWDDGFGRKKFQDQQTHITQNGQNGGKDFKNLKTIHLFYSIQDFTV